MDVDPARFVHGLDPERCRCESWRGLARLDALADATAAHAAIVDAWRAERDTLARLFPALRVTDPPLRSSAVWYLTVPLAVVVLALLRAEIARVCDHVLGRADGSPVRSAFESWADQRRAFAQRRVPGSFGG